MPAFSFRAAPDEANDKPVYLQVSSGIRRLGSRRAYVLPLLSSTAVILVLVFGAGVFQAIEQPKEIKEVEEYLELRAKLDEAFERLPDEHQILLSRFMAASEKYLYSRATAPDDDGTNWSFSGSLYFCVTVITTIGYGSYTPTTTHGKMFLILYALIGIPAFVIWLTTCSEALLAAVKRSLKHVIFQAVDKRWLKTTPLLSLSTLVILVLATFTLLFVLAWSCLFALYNGWTYLDAVYFGFVTVTTIGFGDFAPDTEGVVWLEHFLYIVYFLFGLVSMGTVIAAIQNKTVEHQQEVNFELKKQSMKPSASSPAKLTEMADYFKEPSDSQRSAGPTADVYNDPRFGLDDWEGTPYSSGPATPRDSPSGADVEGANGAVEGTSRKGGRVLDPQQLNLMMSSRVKSDQVAVDVPKDLSSGDDDASRP